MSEETYVAVAFVCGCIFVFWGLRKLLERRKRKSIINDPVVTKSGHHWVHEVELPRGLYCNGCEEGLVHGYECEYCNVKVHDLGCLKKVSASFHCKVCAETQQSTVMRHHWVHGNVASEAFCWVCDEICGGQLGLGDFHCSWCQRSVHTDCKKQVSAVCDFGSHSQSIIPPFCLTMRKGGSRNQKQLVVESVVPPVDSPDWRPLIVIVNPKSGSGAGAHVIKAFRSVLHPMQVVDVTKSSMKTTLRWLDENADVNVRILICGGDGTISLVMDDIDTLQRPPPVAVLPLGTGNDLSRVLGWGKESNGNISVQKMMRHIQNATEQGMDRWTVSIENTRRLGIPVSKKSLSMTNYVSVGVDARVTFGMQSTREQLPKALASRLLNKFLFFTYGTKDIFERACRGLEKRIELVIDGKVIELPDIEGLIFLNIQYWGAGVKVWDENEDDDMPQSMDDGMFEVFAVRSSFHIAQLQVGLSTPIRIGQGREAVVRVLKGPLPMQSDGEAWIQSNATITIHHKCLSRILRKQPKHH